MDIELQLFGPLRGLEPGDRMQLPVAGDTVGALRVALAAHAAASWPRVSPALLRSCALATAGSVARDSDALPPDGRMVVLPPVSGG